MSHITINQPNYSHLLQINGINSEPILIIKGNGVIEWKKDGEFKILVDEKEIAIKEELIQIIIKNYRSGRIEKIFEK